MSRFYPKFFPPVEVDTDAPADGNRYVRKDKQWEEGAANMIAGTSVPPDSVGQNGDYYVNYTTLLIYGPKTGGLWGIAKSLLTGL